MKTTLYFPLHTFLKKKQATQQTFQRYFNVVFGLIWRNDVGQRQINVATTLCISTLEFTTSSNVESTLRISMWIWTTLDNVKSTVIFNFEFHNVATLQGGPGSQGAGVLVPFLHHTVLFMVIFIYFYRQVATKV